MDTSKVDETGACPNLETSKKNEVSSRLMDVAISTFERILLYNCAMIQAPTSTMYNPLLLVPSAPTQLIQIYTR